MGALTYDGCGFDGNTMCVNGWPGARKALPPPAGCLCPLGALGTLSAPGRIPQVEPGDEDPDARDFCMRAPRGCVARGPPREEAEHGGDMKPNPVES